MHLRRTFLILTILLVLTATGWAGVVKKFDPALEKEDLLLIGFGEFTFHALSVDGNKAAFESSNPWLNDDYTANYRTSLLANGNLNRHLFLNGTAVIDSRIGDEYRTNDPSIFRLQMSMNTTEPLWDGWRFTGYGMYDPNRIWEYGNLDTRLLTQPQEPAKLELMAKLESNRYGYLEAGSLHPSFRESRFTLNNRSLFGGYADLHKGAMGLEAAGGKLEGKRFREGTVAGIRANGTSGPYDLTQQPVTRGSETVKIETRDRFSESIVLSSKTLVKDVDYNIDYERGRVLLHQPVSSENIAGDPVYVVITYDYERSADDELLGSRVHVNPSETVGGSVSYLHAFKDDRAVGTGEDEPEDLMAGDLDFNFDNLGSGYFEIAQSQDENSTEDNIAVRGGFKLMPVKRLTLDMDFQEIDDQYKAFTNSDLNPEKNQRRISTRAGVDLGKNQDLYAKYMVIRGLEANGEFNNYPGEREENIYGAGYRNEMIPELQFGLGVELRKIENRTNPALENNNLMRFIVDFDGTRDSAGIFGTLSYGLHYEFIDFENDVAFGAPDRNTNQTALTVASQFSEGNRIQITQKLRTRRLKAGDAYDEREDGTYLTANIRPHWNLNTLTTIEYKRFTVPGYDLSLWQDDPFRLERAGNFALEYLPGRLIKLVGKVGRYEQENIYTDSTVTETDDYVMGQITFFPKHHLSFGFENEYRRKFLDATDDTRTRQWDLGIRANWNRDRLTEATVGMIRRWNAQLLPPIAEIKTVSYILLASASVSLGNGFFTRGAVKEILLRESMDDEKTYTEIEIGYENPKYYRVSIGYERIEGDNGDDSTLDYTGQGVFLRILGKF